ncbi:nucleotidyltransferase family protein [Algoriphagus chordae]|uniref:Polymerase nucleotidyl transferase domain-containing protein n=1 Tax=Algoriphagus chordae TaxID=237019 RepID=A0A2W7QK81_9BACT|nr:nucleotidyltransferase domain-containing protein [Algoriphagus chordae]PZX48928.1 hypothetical protein LV85_03418 [Algoriphagus chordae]
MNLIHNNVEAIYSLCEKHKVEKLYAFGSVLTNSFDEESDVDFDKLNIEDFATNYFEFKFALEDLFNREVDLIEREAIHNPYFKEELEESKLLIYGS